MDMPRATQRQLLDGPMPPALLDDHRLYALAPPDLRQERQTRYRADDQCVPLEAFDPADRALLRRLYALLGELLTLLAEPGAASSALRLKLLAAWLQQIDLAGALTALRDMGLPTEQAQPGPLLRRALHSLRGGCLTSLAVELQIVALGLGDPSDLTLLGCAARDYLATLRACVPDLEPSYRRGDRRRRQSVGLLLETWYDRSLTELAGAAQVVFDCRFFGEIAEGALEFAAVDRMLAGLVGQAARDSQDGLVGVCVLPVPPQRPHSVRFVVSGQPDPLWGGPQPRAARPEALFLEAGPAGGLALPRCAETVAAAYGLADTGAALAGGHVGARLIDGSCVYWFHWPTLVP